ncbi:hypothetical protein HBI70_233590 [Parastagonospora nodorum]|nr:hypothetical protein HBH82_229890 [Parastagonospora nodorum]KAH4661414.1 hypothetical protein HBH78_221920 [Parastagonospora nodorum]KAH4691514.1 hypothetical protein HBH67_242830 [Parastagonospora nodorum]KAH4755780.1 hypothetical protein HBH63_231580 [Parastagonospora nodorum]KAH4769744.1 hypothetical protein HBH62_227360 [Parastagonospora nodorum]
MEGPLSSNQPSACMTSLCLFKRMSHNTRQPSDFQAINGVDPNLYVVPLMVLTPIIITSIIYRKLGCIACAVPYTMGISVVVGLFLISQTITERVLLADQFFRRHIQHTHRASVRSQTWAMYKTAVMLSKPRIQNTSDAMCRAYTQEKETPQPQEAAQEQWHIAEDDNGSFNIVDRSTDWNGKTVESRPTWDMLILLGQVYQQLSHAQMLAQ